ncbi:MAG: hypothetical protein IJ419_13750 [Agathobacter sp.]|nr:hypothetical protein [Agathobacter sp.]
MKKVLALILALTMALCLFGCKNEENPETKPPTFEEEIKNNTPVETKPVDNGELPEDKENLNLQEDEYINGIIIKALLSLDLESLKEYVTEDNYTVLETIANDAAKKDVFMKTFGTSQHLTESNFIMTRSTSHVFAKWYSDMAAAGTLPAKLDDLTTADIENIYNNYYLTAPYQFILLNVAENSISEGSVTVNISEALPSLGIYDISNLDTDNMLVYMFGQTNCERYTNSTSEQLKDLSACFNEGFDMNKIYDYIMAKYPDYNNAENPINWLTEVEPQFTDESNRKKINKWAAENMEVYVSNSEIVALVPLNFDKMVSTDAVFTDTFYGQYMGRLTTNEIELLTSHKVVHPLTTDGDNVTFFEFINHLMKIMVASDVVK